MKKLILMSIILFASTANATSLNPFAPCAILNFDNSECANHAAEVCGYTGDIDKADAGCLLQYGYKPKFQVGADHKSHFCGLSTTQSPATVWGNCSGARG